MPVAATEPTPRLSAGIRAVRGGFWANVALAVSKGVAGVIGHSFALVADSIESLGDILSSVVVWGGLRVAAQDPDREHPWGHGKAEPMSAALVGLMLWVAAAVIMVEAVHGLAEAQPVPAAWTLAVLAAVVVVKQLLYRRIGRVAADTGSEAVAADAWHHHSDSISSAAAFVGVSIAVLGGPAWGWADEAAAMAAAIIIGFTGWRVIRPAAHELMDGAPGDELVMAVRIAATEVAGVCLVEKLMARKAGEHYFVDLHVQADPEMSLYDAHELGHRVNSAIRTAVPAVKNVLVHMEPYLGAGNRSPKSG